MENLTRDRGGIDISYVLAHFPIGYKCITVWTRIERVSHHEFLSVIPKNIDQNFSWWFRIMSQHFFRCQRKSYHVFIDYPIFSNTYIFFFYSYIQGNRCQKANSSWCASLSVNISHKTFMFMWFVLSCLLALETLRILRIFSWISYNFLIIWLIEWFNTTKIGNIYNFNIHYWLFEHI